MQSYPVSQSPGRGRGGAQQGLLLYLKAISLAAGCFEAVHLFKYQLCEHTKERNKKNKNPISVNAKALTWHFIVTTQSNSTWKLRYLFSAITVVKLKIRTQTVQMILYDSHQLCGVSQTIKRIAELKRNHVYDVINGILQKHWRCSNTHAGLKSLWPISYCDKLCFKSIYSNRIFVATTVNYLKITFNFKYKLHLSILLEFGLCSLMFDRKGGPLARHLDHGTVKSRGGTELHWPRSSHHSPEPACASTDQQLTQRDRNRLVKQCSNIEKSLNPRGQTHNYFSN